VSSNYIVEEEEEEDSIEALYIQRNSYEYSYNSYTHAHTKKMPDKRVTRVGRHQYATRSNLTKAVKTPGGKLKAQKIAKRSKGPICGSCKTSLPGIKHLKSSAYKNLKKRERRVSRAYGGTLCHACVKDRVVRAFLLEEQKAVKKVLAERKN